VVTAGLEALVVNPDAFAITLAFIVIAFVLVWTSYD